MRREFEWDENKARRTFDDPFSILTQDRIEGNELRWQTLGMIGGTTVLLVAHTIIEWDEETEIIRINSARHAARSEKRLYEQNRQNILRH
jgi:uncharacterized protein